MGIAENLIAPLGFLLRKKRAGEARSIRHRQELLTHAVFTLESTSFSDGARIPNKYSGIDRGKNISPELHWSRTPEGTQQFLLIMEDIDVPMALPALHVIALFEPDIRQLPEGALTADNVQISYIPVKHAHGRVGYFGPRPLPGHGIHHYWFHLYALDFQIANDHAVTGFDDLLPLLGGHVLAHARFEGIQKG
ncbi:MAG: YbhB/YbcL family Raf kinase inhibitor-like protein [Sporolactobacillus sp.]